MAFLSLVTGVVDSTGERVDLPQTDGTYLPIRLKLGLNLTGTPATNGGQTDVTIDAATVNATYAQIQAALATADADLAVGNSYGVTADHFSSGSDPSLSGAFRSSGGELVTYRDSGTDYAALEGSASLVTLGNATADVEAYTGGSFSVSVDGIGTQLEVGSGAIKLYNGATTAATATGEVGLDATGHLTVWTSGAESSLVAVDDTLSGDLGGTLASPSVVALQGTTVSAAPPALGDVLTYDGTNWAAAAPSGGSSRLIALDAHDLICWTLDEASSPFANTGAGGACSLTAAGDVSPGILSVFSSGAYLKGTSGTRLVSGNSTVGSTATVGTLHGWIKPLSFPAYSSGVVKIYDQIGQPWSSPFMSIGVYFDSSISGAFYAWVAVSGTAHYVHNTTDEWARCVSNQWSHIAVVYNGTNIKAYLNGTLVGTTAAAGVIDWGNGGPWNFGDVINNPGGPQHAVFDEWRFRDVAMSASEVAETYRRGVNWYP